MAKLRQAVEVNLERRVPGILNASWLNKPNEETR
jgi:hypothetical protein